MREREGRAHQSGDDDTAAAGCDAMQRREGEERQVHTEDLCVDAKTAPDVAVVLEAVAVVSRDQRARGRSDRGRDVGETETPHRPEHGERETDEERVAHEIKEGAQRDETERHFAERDHDQVREVLVVEELREAKLHLRDPEIERVLAIRPRVGSLLDEAHVPRGAARSR